MDHRSVTTEDVRGQIRFAFHGSVYPGDPLVPHPGDWEGDLIDRAFRGKHWSQVTTTMVEGQWDRLPLLKLAAQAHYLPAYMLACLDDPDGDHVWFTVGALAWPVGSPKHLDP